MRAALAMIALFAGGCGYTARLGSARTIEAGHLELSTGSHLSLVASGPTRFPAGNLDLGMRYGIADGFDAAASFRGFWTPYTSIAGGSLEAKIQLSRADSIDAGVDLAIAPAAAYDIVYGGDAAGRFVSFALPVLLGLNIEGGHQLVLAPAFVDQWAISEGASPVHQPFFGGSIGFLWRVDDVVALLPSLGLFHSFVGTEGSAGTDALHISAGAFFDLSAL